mgnify:CR=1 FL=1
MVQAKLRNTELKKPANYTIDLGVAYEDDLLVAKELADYLKSAIKINGKKGNLQDQVTVTVNKDKLAVSTKVQFAKRYIKYLVKKYLKKNDILEYLKVIATDKQSYRIKYIKLGENEENEEEAS